MKRPTKLALCALAVIALGAATTALVMHLKRPDLRKRFKEVADSATEIRLYRAPEDSYPGTSTQAKKLVITDKPTILSLLAGVSLEEKKPCGCGHFQYVVVLSPQGKCIVSLCDHCFDVSDGAAFGYYHMPPSFYQPYQNAWQNPTSMPVSMDEAWDDVLPRRGKH